MKNLYVAKIGLALRIAVLRAVLVSCESERDYSFITPIDKVAL